MKTGFILYFQMCPLCMWMFGGGSLCLFKKESSVSFPRDLFSAIRCWVLFTQLDLPTKDWALLYLTKSTRINFWCFYCCVLFTVCVLFLFLVFGFGVEIRSLNSSLFDFIFHGRILKLFRFNNEGILFFSQNCSHLYSCSGLVFLNIQLI